MFGWVCEAAAAAMSESVAGKQELCDAVVGIGLFLPFLCYVDRLLEEQLLNSLDYIQTKVWVE